MNATMPTPVSGLLTRLSGFEPTGPPVVSLYLNLRPDQHGRDNYDVFLRKELKERIQTYPLRSADRESLERDAKRIARYCAVDLQPATNGLALFASAAAGDFFEALQLDAPFEEHRLYVDTQPHLYPLARLNDQFPRYAALLADTNSARLFVFATGRVQGEITVQNPKTRRTSVGGWSQARYQRHVDNFHLQHVKEVVDVLERVVRAEGISHVILAGDDVVIPILRDQLPSHLAERIVDVMRLEIATPEHEVLRATLDALREQDARNDAERVSRMYEAYRSGGLAVVSPRATLAALTNGQVEELLIASLALGIAVGNGEGAEANPATTRDQLTEQLAEELVTRANQTGARVTFIENPELLREVDGVGALLRFRV